MKPNQGADELCSPFHKAALLMLYEYWRSGKQLTEIQDDFRNVFTIVFEQCTIHGLGRLQDLVQFQCQAWIRPEQERLMAKADLSLELSSNGAGALLPKPLLHRTGDHALR